MNIYRRLLAYVKPYRGRLILAILASQGYAVATALVSVTLYVIVNGLQNREEVVIDNIPHVPFLMNIRFSTHWIARKSTGLPEPAWWCASLAAGTVQMQT